ncbi:MAG: hypothetical protein AAFX08_11290 [Pseudomonadota bacterium]
MAYTHYKTPCDDCADGVPTGVIRQVSAELAALVCAVDRLQSCIDNACAGRPLEQGAMIRELQAFDLVAQTLRNLSVFMETLEPADLHFDNIMETIDKLTLTELALRLRADRVIPPSPPSDDSGDVDLF